MFAAITIAVASCNGREDMSADPSDRAIAQLRLRYQMALSAAEQYRQAGFTTIVQDVIIGPMLAEFVAMVEHRPSHWWSSHLNPSEVARREEGRAKTGYGAFTPDQLDAILRADTPRLGFWLDSTDLTVDQTVDQILANLDDAAEIA